MKQNNLAPWLVGIGPLGALFGAELAPHIGKIVFAIIALIALIIIWAFFSTQFFAVLLIIAALFLFYIGFELQKKEKSSELSAKTLLPYALGTVLILTAFLPIVLAINPPDFNTSTRVSASNGWDPPHPGFNGEVLNGQYYISAIALGARSETMVASVSGIDGGGWGDVTGDNIDWYEYQWFYTTSSWGWGNEPAFTDHFDKFPGGADVCAPVGLGRRCDFSPSQFHVNGPVIGWVRVVFRVSFLVWNGAETKELAADDAYIYPGDIATFAWQRGQYSVGQTAVLDYSVGYASNPHPEDPDAAHGNGWWLSVVCKASGVELLNQTIPNPAAGQTRRSGQVRVLVGASCFQTSAPDAACGLNELSAVMYSTFWQAGTRISTVIDDKGLAPSATMAATTSGDWETGDSIVVTITATPNPTTGLSIKEYRFVISPPAGEATSIVQDSSSYTFVALQEGVYTVQGYAIDLGCRPSPALTISARIVEGGGGGTGPPSAEFPWGFLIGTFLLIIAMLIVWLVPIEALRDKDFPQKKLILTVIGVVIYVVIFFGTISSLLSSGG